jgi:hypothetical protein
MLAIHRWAPIVLLAVAMPLVAADEKKKKKGDADTTPPATEQDYKQLAQAREITGKLLNFDPTARRLTIQVEYLIYRPNDKLKGGKGANLQRQQEELLREQQQVLRSRNPAEMMRRLQQLQARVQRLQAQQLKGQKDLFKTEKAHKDFDLETIENVKVRLAQLPTEYDDKGFPKKYTDKELKERKGPDPKLPGYTASPDDVKVGQIVKLTLARKKPAPKPADKDKDEDKDKDKDAAADSHPEVTMIVILKEADDPPSSGDKKGKKKP